MTGVHTWGGPPAGRVLFRASQLSTLLSPLLWVCPLCTQASGPLTSWELAAVPTCTHALCSLLGSKLLAEVVFGAISPDAFLNVESVQKISFSRE